MSDLGDSRLEGGLGGGRGLLHTADLAHVLASGGLDLHRRRHRLQASGVVMLRHMGPAYGASARRRSSTSGPRLGLGCRHARRSPQQCALFDVIVIVDWSAQSSAKRGADSIWSYELDAALPAHGDPINHPTRAEAASTSSSRLQRHAAPTVLLGFDFPLGYPAGFAAAAGSARRAPPPWAATWQHLASTIADDTHNRNNRWAVAAGLNERLGHHRFWVTPPAYAGRHLPMHKPLPALPRPSHRAAPTRTACARSPRGNCSVQEASAVKPSPASMRAHHLRHHPALSHRTRVWPFETGLTAHPTGGPRLGRAGRS